MEMMGPNNINNIIINININNIIINTNNVDNINNKIGDNSGRFYKSPIKPALKVESNALST